MHFFFLRYEHKHDFIKGISRYLYKICYNDMYYIYAEYVMLQDLRYYFVYIYYDDDK